MGRELYEMKNDISAETHFFSFSQQFSYKTIDKSNVLPRHATHYHAVSHR